MTRIAVTTSSFAKYDCSPKEELQKFTDDVIMNPFGRTLNENELLEIATGCSGIIAGTEVYTREILSKLAGTLQVISRCGAGMDNVDLLSAEQLGIQVYNTPDAPTVAVAELTICLILDLLRKVTLMDKKLRSQMWDKRMGNLLQGKKVGIIGLGRIGKRVAQLLMPFGVEVSFFDTFIKNAAGDLRYMEMAELLNWADIITIHSSSADMILGPVELNLMKKGSWIINSSRGHHIDEMMLYEKLKQGHLAGAALDVYHKEPYVGALTELDNVILTPHIGSYAQESRTHMELEAINNLVCGFRKGK